MTERELVQPHEGDKGALQKILSYSPLFES